MTLLLLALACQKPTETPVETEVDPGDTLVALDAPRMLRRLSLDLRGVLPSAEELDAVEADPSTLDSFRDTYLDDPRLEDRLVTLFAERWLTRLDVFEVRYYDYQLDPTAEFEFERSIGEEPLRLMAKIAVDDKPWTDIVTADYTVANEMLASIWPIDYPADASGWQYSTYSDGRPAAGVLSTNGLWWRYVTNISNMNRSRAAAISRLLLCQDLLSRPVSLSGVVALSDEDGTASAIRSNPACVACHSTVDPLASALFGWWTVISYNPSELGYYHAEREELGEEYLTFAPAFFGTPIDGMVDLGTVIANDTRFYSCAAKTSAELLWRRPLEESDFSRVEALRDDFLASDLSFKDLLRATTDTPEYRAGSFTEDATEDTVDREITWRMVGPDMLNSAIEDITGFSWQYEGFNQLANDDPGYRVLAGGVDGYAVTAPQQDPGITWSLTTQRFAQAAASYAVAQQLSEGGERKLLLLVTLDSRPGDADFTAELQQLFWRLYAVRPTDDDIAGAEALWTAVNAVDGPAEAWTRLLSASLRAPEFIGY